MFNVLEEDADNIPFRGDEDVFKNYGYNRLYAYTEYQTLHVERSANQLALKGNHHSVSFIVIIAFKWNLKILN